MKIAPDYNDKYDSPPSYEEAMRYSSMPPVQTLSYPNLSLQQPDQPDNISHSATNVPLHAQQILQRK